VTIPALEAFSWISPWSVEKNKLALPIGTNIAQLAARFRSKNKLPTGTGGSACAGRMVLPECSGRLVAEVQIVKNVPWSSLSSPLHLALLAQLEAREGWMGPSPKEGLSLPGLRW
jgi:hypothetical protein